MDKFQKIERNKERALAWRTLEFMRDLARKTERFHYVFGFIPLWRFKVEYKSPLSLRGNEREPPALDGAFLVTGKSVLSGNRWIPILYLTLISSERGNVELPEVLQFRSATSKKRRLRIFPVCDVYEPHLVRFYMREDVRNFVSSVFGDFRVRFMEWPKSSSTRTGKTLEKWQITTRTPE